MDYLTLINQISKLKSTEHGIIKVITDIKEISQVLTKDQAINPMYGFGICYEDPYIYLIRDLVEFPDGIKRGYARVIPKWVFNGGNGIAVIGYMNGKILLLHNFRHPTQSWHYEIVRGFGEPNMKAEENVMKELMEEVNASFSRLIYLGDIHPDTGLEQFSAKLFFASITNVGDVNINEGIDKICWVTVPEIERMIKNNEITDSFTIVAYTRAKLKGLFLDI